MPTSPDRPVHHLMPVAEGAAMAGVSTKLFVAAVARGEFGAVEILLLGASELPFVRASSLVDFLEGRAVGGTVRA